ncbi:ArsR/SmtB family transcription factor [Agromyces luteolus]|uniref:Metalloregulator ArsR/SmtB family transcription factor n=1 Tax=Agromyces luteolus TaxID=88373 RepID=A0A7C9LUI2_9MICO|nr:metalloregulator ArsR/SmtB family transcription factor [Agromyces luteolus]MUN06119.1 metalloregulator ArsR/SmtB family transcription factor [Agromyces luteolus]
MDAFHALADATRRRLLERLAGGPRSAGDLAAGLPMSRPAVSKHLGLLLESGLVEVEPVGRLRHYRLRREALAVVRRFLDVLEQPPIPSEAFAALDLEVRRTTRDTAAEPHRGQEIA